ncbi:hypothetical protein DMH27_27375 [Raoultella planticola]|nr:hypothetical protein [Raoultella planticola]
MTSISEKAGWDDIYQIKRSDRVEGGRTGVANVRAEQLAGRTLYLKQQLESFSGLLESGEMPYASEDEVIAQIQAGKIKDGDVFPSVQGTRFTGWKSLHARAVCRYHAVNTCRHPLPLSQS